ncbi:hypothetical protein [Spirosoma sp. KUDC1026]|uniref:hypothetical protein n=1 Tax=Spirosoma sp. KUDC1026 TaxID=2745947 RepID=UPI00159BCC75|nr:hypothetical protein [Spirosoma sp. KUDC1026]QKZ11650.1 hypothetical protein HU175_03000 [Spirosoma sp. KUDC1026]
MEDPKILFADTTERRAQLMAATERFKSSITDGVDTIKEDASEVGKTVAFVAGVSLAVYLVVNAVLPKSAEYRYAEKYGEPDEADYDYDEYDEDAPNTAPSTHKAVKRQADKTQKSAAASGLIGGLITSVLTNIAREQLTSFIARIRQNNAVNPAASPTEYHESAPTQPVDYTPGA